MRGIIILKMGVHSNLDYCNHSSRKIVAISDGSYLLLVVIEVLQKSRLLQFFHCNNQGWSVILHLILRPQIRMWFLHQFLGFMPQIKPLFTSKKN